MKHKKTGIAFLDDLDPFAGKSKIVKKAAKAQGIKVKKLRLVKVNAADIKGLPSAAYCPKCGQHFIVHNDDGSCVK